MTAALELHELNAQRGPLGNEVRFIEQRHQVFRPEGARCEIGEHAQVQDADHVVDVVTVHGKARVHALVDDVLDRFRVVIEVDSDDLVVWNHDIVDRDLLQIQDAEQHLPVTIRDAAAGLMDHGAQFFARQRLQLGVARAYSKQEQDGVRRGIGQPDQGIGDLEQRVVDQGRGERHAFGIQRGESLRRGLGEDQDDQRQAQRADRDRRFAPEIPGDDRDQRGGEDVDEIVAEQDQADDPARPAQQSFGQARAAVAVARLVAELIAIQTHQRRFRTRKEG